MQATGIKSLKTLDNYIRFDNDKMNDVIDVVLRGYSVVLLEKFEYISFPICIMFLMSSFTLLISSKKYCLRFVYQNVY